jgi:hypothetical protein
MTNRLTLLDVKHALRDSRFRLKLPPELNQDVEKFLQNPGCACNMPIYRKVMKLGRETLKEYYPDKEWSDPDEEVQKLAQNQWSVINCHVDELEDKLKKLPPGRKQLAVTRFQDQVTVIVNELEAIF